jgi:DNA topoisomerase-2
MKLFSLSNNKMKELTQERDRKRNEYNIYMKMTIKELWTRELDEFMTAYDKWFDYIEDEETNTNNNTKKVKGRKTKATKTDKTDKVVKTKTTKPRKTKEKNATSSA